MLKIYVEIYIVRVDCLFALCLGHFHARAVDYETSSCRQLLYLIGFEV